jgi:trans-aconitate 2-methyltransferase
MGARETVGIDSSPAMLERAATVGARGLRFERGDLADFAPGSPVDLVFSNAALHWVPGHGALFTRLRAALAPGGQLAIQVPANHDTASHVIAYELAGEPPFAAALGEYRRYSPVLPPDVYAELLFRLGFRTQHVRMQVYGHELEGPEAVVEWVRGTLLVDYQKRLPPELFDTFVERYRERLLARIADARPYFFAFKRILIWGRLSS